jgi:4'-phosphopantetheinyl transferase
MMIGDIDTHEPLDLPAQTVQVWEVAVPAEAMMADLVRLLIPSELVRAARFRVPGPRGEFITGRAVLRHLLGRYADCDPRTIVLQANAYGKLHALGAFPHFNIAHSGGRVLLAFAGAALGVDIERIRVDFATVEIARHYFSEAEQQVLAGLPSHQQVEAFFRCWALKEAYIKAQGSGLSLALDRFDVAFAPGVQAALLATHDDPAEAGRWQLMSLPVAAGYAAALAIRGQGWQIEQQSFHF